MHPGPHAWKKHDVNVLYGRIWYYALLPFLLLPLRPSMVTIADFLSTTCPGERTFLFHTKGRILLSSTIPYRNHHFDLFLFIGLLGSKRPKSWLTSETKNISSSIGFIRSVNVILFSKLAHVLYLAYCYPVQPTEFSPLPSMWSLVTFWSTEINCLITFF